MLEHHPKDMLNERGERSKNLRRICCEAAGAGDGNSRRAIYQVKSPGDSVLAFWVSKCYWKGSKIEKTQCHEFIKSQTRPGKQYFLGEHQSLKM